MFLIIHHNFEFCKGFLQLLQFGLEAPANRIPGSSEKTITPPCPPGMDGRYYAEAFARFTVAIAKSLCYNKKIASLTDSLTVCRQMPCGRETEKASLEFGERQSACPFWPLSQNERGDKL